jgi:ectoine hydroxylase-related dioxygenase (phytanoyl-CoA dioxygenase family)
MEIFIDLATHPLLIDLCQRILSDNFVLLQQNGIINPPENQQFQKRWHRDLPYQHFILDGTSKIAINALFCLDPFKVETGGTCVLPGSHKFADFPSDNFVRKNQFNVDVPEGSILIMDAMCFHRSGNNTSQIIRRGVNHVIGLPMLVPQFDFTKLLNEEFEKDIFLNKYLGWRWNPKSTIKSCRQIRKK